MFLLKVVKTLLKKFKKLSDNIINTMEKGSYLDLITDIYHRGTIFGIKRGILMLEITSGTSVFGIYHRNLPRKVGMNRKSCSKVQNLLKVCDGNLSRPTHGGKVTKCAFKDF